MRLQIKNYQKAATLEKSNYYYASSLWVNQTVVVMLASGSYDVFQQRYRQCLNFYLRVTENLKKRSKTVNKMTPSLQ